MSISFFFVSPVRTWLRCFDPVHHAHALLRLGLCLLPGGLSILPPPGVPTGPRPALHSDRGTAPLGSAMPECKAGKDSQRLGECTALGPKGPGTWRVGWCRFPTKLWCLRWKIQEEHRRGGYGNQPGRLTCAFSLQTLLGLQKDWKLGRANVFISTLNSRTVPRTAMKLVGQVCTAVIKVGAD